MKTFIFLTCVCLFTPVWAEDTDRYSYCESCVIAARELEKVIKDVPIKSRQPVEKKLLKRDLCDKLISHKDNLVQKETLKSSCQHLLDSHYYKFRDALRHQELKNLDITLCYEQSMACVGVKRRSDKDPTFDFKESDLDALIKANKEKLHITRPTRPASSTVNKDEL